jgi:Transposase IS4
LLLLQSNTTPLAVGRELHGYNVLVELVKPWAGTNAIVVADSYFASVGAALHLKRMGLRFIGTIKTATKEFPMAYLGSHIMADGKGDQHGVIHNDHASGASLLAFCWVDRDRRYFITTCSSLTNGPPCQRQRWRQVDKTPNAKPELVDIHIEQPEACHIYYSGCGRIDQHNRHRQANLQLEKKIKTMFWHRRVNLSLFSMCVVDSFLLMQSCRGVSCSSEFATAKDYFMKLAEMLIDNAFEERNLRRRRERVDVAASHRLRDSTNTFLESHLQLYGIEPTKRMKVSDPTHCFRGRCMICKQPTCYVCRECQRFQTNPKGHQFFCCDRDDLACMGAHILHAHPDGVRSNNGDFEA